MLFEDETCSLFGHVVEGRFFIHSKLTGASKASNIKHYSKILEALEDRLYTYGLREYFTMADSVSGFRFNELLGFETVYEVWNETYEVMRKEI